MKLTSNLKLRPDFLYVTPLVTVVMLLLIFFLLNSKMVVQSGMRVEPPLSSSSLRTWENAHVITITAGAEPMMFFNSEPTTLAALPERLKAEKSGSRYVIINADALAPHGTLVAAQDLVLTAGFQLGIGTGLKDPPDTK